jgi:hypothetical protein
MHNGALQIIVRDSWILPTLMQCFERSIEWSIQVVAQVGYLQLAKLQVTNYNQNSLVRFDF